MVSLFLPNTIQPSGIWQRRSNQARAALRKVASWRTPESQPREHPGRKFGATAAGWVFDLVARRKVLILCWRCQPKFDHKRSRYYKDGRFPYVIGKCDGCREHVNQAKLYIHESFLGEPGGRTMAGQVWTPL